MSIEPRFIQIHSLHTYPAALLNRDDAGLAKRLPFGDAVRTRISSQCLKRHWRVTDDPNALRTLDVPMAVRSRALLGEIRNQLVARELSEDLAQAAAEGLRDGGLLDKGAKEKKPDGKAKGKKGADEQPGNDSGERRGAEALKTGQAVLLGRAEIDHLVEFCAALAATHPQADALRRAVREELKAQKKNLEALKHGSGLESALFGRMVTSDILTSRDAAVYVAHAFTVHPAQVENDYFTVVDDLTREAGELGSAGIFDTELASGLYYGYVVVDVRQLVANLEGVHIEKCFNVAPEQRHLAGQVVQRLLYLIATVSPGAKRGSTAPFDWARLLLVEAGPWQPRSLAGAFHNALPLGGTDAIMARATERLAAELTAFDAAYEMPLARRVMTTGHWPVQQDKPFALAKLAAWTAEIISCGRVEPAAAEAS